MQKKIYSINLLKESKNDALEKIINWSLGVGRILIIVTELIALTTFLYRFTLDQQLVDLHSEIKQKEAIINQFKKQEDEYRNLQERLSLISNFSTITEKREKIYEDIFSFAPAGLKFNQISLFENSLSIEVSINSVSSLTSFINSLKSSPEIESVSVDKIESKTANAVIVVGITTVLKPIPNKYAIEDK